jgi:membrane fusion protein (multidrug efflux system)
MAEADPSLQESKADEAPAEPRRWGRLLLMLSVPLALLVGGFLYWQSLQGKVSTDNAYLQQDMVAPFPWIAAVSRFISVDTVWIRTKPR